jgi:hypothetical protein
MDSVKTKQSLPLFITKSLSSLYILLISFFIVGCLSVYPKYEKTPCDQIDKENLIKIALSSGFKEKEVSLTTESFSFAKKTIVFSEIEKAYVRTKGNIFGRMHYWVVITSKSGKNFSFETDDKALTIEAYSAYECLAGIISKSLRPSDKYDKLKKLKDLFDSGAITKEEYEIEKNKILKEN